VKEQSPLGTTFVIELANGYNGYLPTPEHHELGGYETWRARSSYLAEDAEPKIRQTVLDLLEKVAGDTKVSGRGGDTATPPVQLSIASWEDVQARVRRHTGRVVAVNIWTTTCPACVEEFPGYVELQEKYGDKLVCIAVNCDYDGIKSKPPEYYRDRVTAALRELQAGGLENVLLNIPLIDFLDQIDLSSSPAIYVYDHRGELARRFDNDNIQSVDDEFTLEQVDALIAKLVSRE
jgi:thiol-disulfide isomerase/thioredoxin